MKMGNEEIVQRAEYLETLDKVAPQTNKLGYAIATNKRKMAEAVQDYAKIKNEAVARIREELDFKDDDDDKTKKEKTAELNKRLEKELKDIAWIKQDVDIFKLDPEDVYSSSLNSRQMAGILWMVKGNEPIETKTEEPEKAEGEIV